MNSRLLLVTLLSLSLINASLVSFVQIVEDASLELRVNNGTTILFQAQEYNTASPYIAVPAGSYSSAELFFANGTLAKKVDVPFNLSDNTDYTFVASGAADKAELKLSGDDNTSPQSAATFRLRVFEAVLNRPTAGFDVSINGVKQYPTTGFEVYSSYQELPSGAAQVTLYEGGTNIIVAGFPKTYTFVGGNVETLYLSGDYDLVKHGNVSILAQVSATYTFVAARFAHLSVNASKVDILINGEPVVKGLAYGEVSTVVRPGLINASLATVEITAENDRSAVFWSSNNVAFNTYPQNLVTVSGLTTDLSVNVTNDNVAAPASAQNARVYIVHAVFNQEAVVWKFAGESDTLYYTQSTKVYDVAVGTYTFELDTTGGAEIHEQQITVESGTDYILIIQGAVGYPNQPITVNRVVSGVYQYFGIRAHHASQNSDPVTVTLKDSTNPANNRVIATGLVYGGFSAYVENVVLRNYTVEFATATKTLFASYLSVGANTLYTVVLEGLDTQRDGLNSTLFADNLDAPETNTKSRVTFYHFLAGGNATETGGAPAVDILVNGDKVVTGLTYKSASAQAAYDGGYKNISIVAGTTYIKNLTNVLFTPGAVIGIWVEGDYKTPDPIVDVVLTVDAAYEYSYLSVGHAVEGLGAVDLYISNPDVADFTVTNLNYKAISGKLFVPFNAVSSIYNIRVSEPGKNNDLLTVPFAPKNFSQTLWLFGTATPLVAATSVTPDLFDAPTLNTDARVRLGNLVLDTVTVTFNGKTHVLTQGQFLDFEVVDSTVGYTLTVSYTNTSYSVNGVAVKAGSVNELIIVRPAPGYLQVEDVVYQYGFIRAFHGAVGVGAVNVELNGKTVITNLEFTNVTAYLPIQVGNGSVLTIRDAKTQQVVETLPVNVEAKKYSTLAAYGDAGTPEALKFVFLPSEQTPPEGANVKLRFVNLAYPSAIRNSSVIDVYVNGAVAVAGLAYGGESNYWPSTNIPFVIDLVVAGENLTTAFYKGDRLDLGAGAAYSFFIAGQTVSSRDAVVTQVVDYVPPPVANIRFINTVSDIPAIEVLVNGLIVDANLAFKAATAYAAYQVPTDTTSYTYVAAGKDYNFVKPTARANTYSVYSTGLANSSLVEKQINSLVLSDNNTIPAEGQVRVRFVNLVVGVENITEVKLADTVYFSNVLYNTTSPYVELKGDLYTVSLNAIENVTVHELTSAPADLKTSTGAVYTLVAVGTAGHIEIQSYMDGGSGPLTPASSSKGASGLPGWAIGLIVVGAILVLVAIGVAGWMIYKRRRTGYTSIPERDA